MSIRVNLSYRTNHSLHGVTVPSAVVTGRHYSACPSSRKDRAKRYHDTAGTPPVTTEWPDKALGMGRDSHTVPINAPTTTDRRSMTRRDKTRHLPHEVGLGRWSPEDSD
jgi:hypothetical protein